MKAQNVTSMVLASVLLAGCSKAVLAEPGPGEQPPSVGPLLAFIDSHTRYSSFKQVLDASGYRGALRDRLATERLTILPVTNYYFDKLSRTERTELRTNQAKAREFITRHVLIGEWTLQNIARTQFLPSVFDEEHGQDPSVRGGLDNLFPIGECSLVTGVYSADEGYIIDIDHPVHLNDPGHKANLQPGATRRIQTAPPGVSSCKNIWIIVLGSSPAIIRVTHADGTSYEYEVPAGTSGWYECTDYNTIDIVNPSPAVGGVAIGVAWRVAPC